jgi:hypothetical protein
MKKTFDAEKIQKRFTGGQGRIGEGISYCSLASLNRSVIEF